MLRLHCTLRSDRPTMKPPRFAQLVCNISSHCFRLRHKTDGLSDQFDSEFDSFINLLDIAVREGLRHAARSAAALATVFILPPSGQDTFFQLEVRPSSPSDSRLHLPSTLEIGDDAAGKPSYDSKISLRTPIFPCRQLLLQAFSAQQTALSGVDGFGLSALVYEENRNVRARISTFAPPSTPRGSGLIARCLFSHEASSD